MRRVAAAVLDVRARGLRKLIDQGCIGVIWAAALDNFHRARGPTSTNGRCPRSPGAAPTLSRRVLLQPRQRLLRRGGGADATWLARQGHRRIGVFNEISPNGEEYFRYFRWACDALGLKIVRLETITQTPDDLESSVIALRDANADALAYMGYGYPTIFLGAIFRKLGWNPPRIMTTAIQFGYARPEWMEALEGWVGIDQYCEDNPLLEPFLDRFEKRFGRRPHTNTVVTLSYDSARVFAEAIRRAPLHRPA